MHRQIARKAPLHPPGHMESSSSGVADHKRFGEVLVWIHLSGGIEPKETPGLDLELSRSHRGLILVGSIQAPPDLSTALEVLSNLLRRWTRR